MANTEWMDNLLNGKVEKEASLIPQGENKEAHENLKIENSNWVKEAMELDPVAVEAEYQAKLVEEAKLLGKTAAQEELKSPEQVIESDYERQVKAYSDSNLVELLALARAHKDNVTAEQFSEYKEKAKKNVESGRAKCEEELIKLAGEHTLLDWQAAFKKFHEEAKVEQPKEKELYAPEVPEKAHSFDHPKEEKLSKDEKEVVAPGNGREADERKEVTEQPVPQVKEASLEVKARCEKCVGPEVNCACPCHKEEGWKESSQEVKAEPISPLKREELPVEINAAEEHCPVCGSVGEDLGNLGNKDHFRCRDCGIMFSHEKEATACVACSASQEIKSQVSKEETIKKVAELSKQAEVKSPWAIVVDPATGKECIARVGIEDKNIKESEEDKKDLQK